MMTIMMVIIVASVFFFAKKKNRRLFEGFLRFQTKKNQKKVKEIVRNFSLKRVNLVKKNLQSKSSSSSVVGSENCFINFE